MPFYCWKDEDSGERGEVFLTVGQMIDATVDEGRGSGFRFRLEDGRIVTRDLRAEHGGFKNTSGNWPMKSDAAGVAADQVDEARAHSESIGIPTDFTPDGRAIFRSRQHRKRYCEAIGLYDRNGGPGDPQRR